MRIGVPIVVFVSGAVVMILELAASRIIAPHLGTSVIVWTSLIGVILAALSFGNWVGGRIADRWPQPRVLALLLLIAAALIAFSAHFQSFLSVISAQMDLQAGAVIGVLIIFGPATIALGTIAPFGVKLSLLDIARTGRAVGNLYALSNTGSIVGTFLGGFILISYVGSTKIVLGLSLALVLLAILVMLVARVRLTVAMSAATAAVALAAAYPAAPLFIGAAKQIVADVDTRYNRTWIYDQKVDEFTVRVMSNSVSGSQSAMLLEHPGHLIVPYIRMYDVYEAFAPKARSALMIGGSAYTYPRHFIGKSDENRMTVAEIDSGVTQLAREYFGLTDHPRLAIVHEDGRTHLNRANPVYDVIFIDAFSSHHTIPFHLTTIEAVQRIARNLAPAGVVLVNIIASFEGDSSAFLAAQFATYQRVFPHVKLYKVEPGFEDSKEQNVMLIAAFEPLEVPATSRHVDALASRQWQGALAQLPPLTDDFAPIERYTRLVAN